MFPRFKINGRLITSTTQWAAYASRIPYKLQDCLVEQLRRIPGRGVPNFTRRGGGGQTLLAWARGQQKGVSYQLLQEIVHLPAPA